MIRLAWRNLTRNKLRTLLTVASVALALFVLAVLVALVQAIESTEGTVANRVVVRHAVSLTFDLPEAFGGRLTRLDHVDAVTPLSWFGGVYIDQRPENFFPRFASDPATLFDVFGEYSLPEAEREAWTQDRSGFIAGRALAEKYDWAIGERITIQGDIYPVDLELTLRGIFTHPDLETQERQLFFHRRYLEESLGNPGRVGTYWLLLDAPESVPAVVRGAEAMFESSDAPVRAETEEAFALSFLEMLGNLRLLIGSIGLAIVISILFITANTMAMAARDRTREVAVLRTLGFRRGQVTGLVLAEAVAVGVFGAVCGVGLAVLAIGGLREGMGEVFPAFAALEASPAALGLALAIGAGVGLLSGLAPALGAARIDIVDGLRRVG
ncbi:MAG: ABC transporter permease [Acidobacteriota bacterium]